MEEKRNYVIYIDNSDSWTSSDGEKERVVKMTKSQADVIYWFMKSFDINGAIVLAENYEGEEI